MDSKRYSVFSDLSLESTLSPNELPNLEEELIQEETSISSCSVKGNTNPLEWVTYNEAYCFDLERFTKKYVDALTTMAVGHLYPKHGLLKAEDVVKPIVEEMAGLSDSVSELITVSPTQTQSELWKWPKISEFNIKFGLEKVQEYVNSWKRSDGWLFSVEFLGWETEDCSNIFVYEVEWSKPTPAYPIPQATASVYFALEVFKMVPYCFDRQVGVTYVFEMSNVIHFPGYIDFQEKWLQDIINAKLKFFKSIAFLNKLLMKACNIFEIDSWPKCDTYVSIPTLTPYINSSSTKFFLFENTQNTCLCKTTNIVILIIKSLRIGKDFLSKGKRTQDQ